MRQPRIKLPPSEGSAIYHCISRTVNGEWLFRKDSAKEMFRRMAWQVADYCGVYLLTYAVMANHPHLKVLVPKEAPVSDAELLRRYAVLYLRPSKRQTARLEVIQAQLAENGPEAVRWRQRQLRQMGDISAFMKLLKQRYTTWYNRTHGRYGTLWSERFKSVLVEDKAELALIISTYIDLNPVRAGIVLDPKDYRFCGYAEAVAGNTRAQQGLMRITETTTWPEAQAAYRTALFAIGSGPRERGQMLEPSQLAKVIKAGGKLSRCEVLRCRARYLTGSAVLGTEAFVQAQLSRHHRRSKPKPLPPVTDWGGMVAFRSERQVAVN